MEVPVEDYASLSKAWSRQNESAEMEKYIGAEHTLESPEQGFVSHNINEKSTKKCNVCTLAGCLLFAAVVVTASILTMNNVKDNQVTTQQQQQLVQCQPGMVKDTRQPLLEIYLTGISRLVNQTEAKELEKAVQDGFNEVSEGCDDLYERIMYNVSLVNQLIHNGMTFEEDTSQIENSFNDQVSLLAVFETRISCDGCSIDEAFASEYPATFGNGTSNGFARRLSHNIVGHDESQPLSGVASKVRGDAVVMMRPRKLVLASPLNAGEIVTSIEGKIAGLSDEFTGITKAVIVTGASSEKSLEKKKDDKGAGGKSSKSKKSISGEECEEGGKGKGGSTKGKSCAPSTVPSSDPSLEPTSDPTLTPSEVPSSSPSCSLGTEAGDACCTDQELATNDSDGDGCANVNGGTPPLPLVCSVIPDISTCALCGLPGELCCNQLDSPLDGNRDCCFDFYGGTNLACTPIKGTDEPDYIARCQPCGSDGEACCPRLGGGEGSIIGNMAAGDTGVDSCGAINTPCCRATAFPCAVGSVCDFDPDFDLSTPPGTCVPCGSLGQKCCNPFKPGEGPLCDSTMDERLVCDFDLEDLFKGAVASVGTCQSCGGNDEPCCTGDPLDACDVGFICDPSLAAIPQGSFGFCKPCGEVGQPCCIPGLNDNEALCNSDGSAGRLVCDLDFKLFDGSVGQCVECGETGQPCCNDFPNPCDQGNNCDPSLKDILFDGVLGECKACGIVGTPCCTPLFNNNGLFACERGTVCQGDFQFDFDGDIGDCVLCGDEGQPCCNILKSDFGNLVDNIDLPSLVEDIVNGDFMLDDLVDYLIANVGDLRDLDPEYPCGDSLFPIVGFPNGDRLQCVLDDPFDGDGIIATCECGGDGQVCCGSDPIGTCDVGFACREFTSLTPNYKCETCGNLGQLCCDGPTKCLDPTLGCKNNGVLQESTCVTCGLLGNPCCAGNVCAAGGLCQGGTCQTCGGVNEVCCPGDTCNTGTSCLKNALGPNTCQVCGGAKQRCCPANTCTASYPCLSLGTGLDICSCGLRGQPCCPAPDTACAAAGGNALLFTTDACDGGTNTCRSTCGRSGTPCCSLGGFRNCPFKTPTTCPSPSPRTC